uniref:BED-type domain-containing protein n=1 Tax=Latimeria chalumnae TaxID=7897 RepID=H3AVY0_LATCH
MAVTDGVSFQHWKFRDAFIFKKEKDKKNILVECNLCRPKVKVLSTSKSSTSNLKKHLEVNCNSTKKKWLCRTRCQERVHSGYVNKTGLCLSAMRNATQLDLDDDEAVDSSGAVAPKKSPSQKAVDRLIMDFVIEDVQAFSVVEQPSFIALVKCLAPNCSIMCHQTLTERVERAYENMKVQLKAKFEGVRTICTTADIWSVHGRSFLGITAHWLDGSTLGRHSVALACCRMKGRHTYDLIAAKIEEVHAAFGIHRKVCHTVTDNGSNFVKAFKKFADFREAEGDIQASEDEEEDTVVFSDLDQILTEGSLDDDAVTTFSLPPHQRCAAHTLHQVAAKDAHDYLSAGPLTLKKLFRSTIAKLSALWNKCKRSPQVHEVIAEKAKTQLIVPNATRWNSFYQACSKIQSIPEEVLHDICDCLNLERLREIELIFLDEYCRVMEPLACALDILQGESKCFIGFLLPTISALQKKLEAMKHSLKLATPLADAILGALQKRFGTYFEDRNLILASITIPQFRMHWMDESSTQQASGYLLDESSRTAPEELSPSQALEMETDDEEDFFQFNSGSKSSSGAEEEVFQFLRDGDKKLSCVLKYPLIKQMFITYNTPLPSSAPVEGLFTLGGRVLTPLRNQLNDDWFEKLVLLRFNKGIVNLKD